jgi:hypothetical protein
MRKSYDFSNSVSNPYAKSLKEQKKRSETLLSTPTVWQHIRALFLFCTEIVTGLYARFNFKHTGGSTRKTNKRIKPRAS